MTLILFKNANWFPARNIIKSKIDVKAGNMTFSQRIELGKILTTSVNESVKMEKTIQLLHEYRPKLKELPRLITYFQEIIDGMIYWNAAENKLLKYEPTPEEKRAGISELSKKIGELGTVTAMAEKYSQDPDVILKWKYSKVFGLLLADLEKAKFNKRYMTAIKKS